jgi:hypothetical protein
MLLASFSFSAVILVFFISIVTEDIMVSIFIKIDTVPRARLQPEHHPKKGPTGIQDRLLLSHGPIVPA